MRESQLKPVLMAFAVLVTATCSSDKKPQQKLAPQEKVESQTPLLSLKPNLAESTPQRSRLVKCATDLDSQQINLLSLSDAPISKLDIWVYRYEEDTMLEPIGIHSDDELVAKGETRLPLPAIAQGTSKVECEVSAATLETGEIWTNQDLVYTLARPRPKAGEGKVALDAKLQRPVGAVWNKETRQLEFQNHTERPIEVQEIRVRFSAPKAAVASNSVMRLSVALKPSESTIALAPTSLPKDAKIIKATVSRAKFTDTEGGSWQSQQ